MFSTNRKKIILLLTVILFLVAFTLIFLSLMGKKERLNNEDLNQIETQIFQQNQFIKEEVEKALEKPMEESEKPVSEEALDPDQEAKREEIKNILNKPLPEEERVEYTTQDLQKMLSK